MAVGAAMPVDDRCTCAALATSQPAQLTLWRDVCTRFFFQHDAVARRVLAHFESASGDQIVIETQESEPTSADGEMRELIAALRVPNCLVAGHKESYNDAVIAMERVKNDVRSGYHRHVAMANYEAFHAHLAQAGQSTNLDPWTNPDGSQHLIIRIHEHYVRSMVAQSAQQLRVDEFIKLEVGNIGCHPFLAGLRHLLEWNLASPTVFAWRVSDATFVENGSDFAHAAVRLLLQELNCGHIISPPAPTEHSTTRHRLWYLDPYMSDYDIKQLLKLFPAASRLESRSTGDRMPTDVHRANADGAHDEYQPFLIQKWCFIL